MLPPVDLGNAVDEELGEILWREPRPLNTKRGSILSSVFACGALLLAAYGSLTSPAGVNGLLYAAALAAREGLDSRELVISSPVAGPIEKAPRCLVVFVLDSAERLVGLVESWPEEPGLEMDWFVDELGGDVRAISGPASESASNFCNGTPFVGASAVESWVLDADGVSGGVCIADDLGLARGDGLPEDS